jgi:hypothetical protein
LQYQPRQVRRVELLNDEALVKVAGPNAALSSVQKQQHDRGRADVMRRAFVLMLGLRPGRYRELAEQSAGE